LKPPAAFRIVACRTQFRRPRPGSIGDLDPDDALPGPDRDRNRLPGSTRAAVPDRITEDLANQQDRVISARVPRPSTSETNERAARARSARPASVTLSRTAALAISAPAFPAALAPGNLPGSGGRRDIHAQLCRERQAAHCGASADLVRGSSVDAAPVRGRPCKADGPAHRSHAPIPVRYASVDRATRGSTTRQDDT
jgi:hypothetical protein